MPHPADDAVANNRSYHHSIPRHPGTDVSHPILAAGAVVWRRDASGSIEFACIHRPHYDDWSLAKGKVDPGESLPVTAVREIREETGLHVELGSLLGRVTYPIKDHTKVIYYWEARFIDGDFVANDEVDQLLWLTAQQAHHTLSYDADKNIVDRAVARLTTPITSRILLVRHAKSVDAQAWDGDDRVRPLSTKGKNQAELLAPAIAGYRPTAVFSATPQRCIDTATPIAVACGSDVVQQPELDDAAWLNSPTASRNAVMTIVNTTKVAVVVAQGTLISELIKTLSDENNLGLSDIPAKKASVWSLAFHDNTLVNADYLQSPLPVE